MNRHASASLVLREILSVFRLMASTWAWLTTSHHFSSAATLNSSSSEVLCPRSDLDFMRFSMLRNSLQVAPASSFHHHAFSGEAEYLVQTVALSVAVSLLQKKKVRGHCQWNNDSSKMV